MHIKHHHVEQSNRILRLSPNEIKDPRLVVAEFFMTYHLKDVREDLWEWLSAGLTSSNEYFNTGRDRANLIFLYENLEKLVEASYLLTKRAERRKRRKGRAGKLPTPSSDAV